MKSNRNRKKMWLLSSVAVLFVIGGLLTAAAALDVWPFYPAESQPEIQNPVNYDEPTEQQQNEGEKIKEDLADEPFKEEDQEQMAQPSAGIEITVAETNGDMFIIRALSTGPASGQCTLSMSGPNGSTYSESAALQPMPNASTCKGFNIPLSQVSTGRWIVNVTHSYGDASATATKDIEI